MKAEKFRITYEIYDGYAGGSRPQHTSISADDFDVDASEDALREMFDEEINRAMLEKVSAYSRQEDEFVAWAKEQQERQRKEDAEHKPDGEEAH